MKPISSLSSFLSSTANGSLTTSNPGDRVAANRTIDAGHSNTPTANSSPESSSSTATSPSSQDEKQGQQLIKTLRETPLSVLKLTPLSMLTNNKVGASFIPQREALMNYGQQSATAIAGNLLVLPIGARKSRDSGSLLFMLAFLGFLAYIIWDGLVIKETDVNLIVHGHDSYGNICGRNNKPIRFVEKSGKNYTDKPFTKYTLINSQFERYTLDSNRFSKHGELFYVKQQPDDPYSADIKGDHNTEQPTQRNQRLIQALNRINQKAAPSWRVKRAVSSGSHHDDPLASSTMLLAFNDHQTRENRTLLNQLKSRLMYQYPAMYGYNPEPAPTRQSTVATHQGKVRFSTQEVGAPDVLAASSQIERTFATLRPTILTTNIPTLTQQQPQSISTTFQSVVFDDHVGNDSDRYEHMLVTPTSTNGLVRPRQTIPEVLNQNEVSNQLLYLTECVDYCPPSDHVELIFYRCMPKNWRFSLFPSAINVTRTFIDEILTDLSHCYREFIYIYSFGLVLSLVLLISLRFLASFIIWSCISLLIALLISMASYSWLNYYYQIIDLNTLMPHGPVYSEKLASSDKWLIGSIFLTFLAFASIGVVIFMRKRIFLVTMLFRESGKAIADMPLLLLQPLLTFAALIAITVIWSAGLICLQSIKMPIIDMSTGFVVFKAEILYKIMKWYHIFAFLWVSHFAIACQHYVIGASVSKWYFATDRYNLHSPIGASISELILYYLGSVALGSFLVAIFKVIRIITRQIQFLVQRNCMSPQNSPGGQTMNTASSLQQMSPTSCCGSFTYVWRFFIWFLDNIVMIISRDAYVEIAIHGDSFIAGAQRAFNVLSSNPLKLLAIKSVSNMLLVGAKICVVFGTVSIAMVLLEEKTTQLNYSWSPIVISAIYAYIVAHWFLSVYEMVIDALFICYCEDYERSKNRELSNQLISSNFMAQFLNNTQNNNIQTVY